VSRVSGRSALIFLLYYVNNAALSETTEKFTCCGITVVIMNADSEVDVNESERVHSFVGCRFYVCSSACFLLIVAHDINGADVK